MNQGTYPLAAGMINQINRLDMVSNNLANANTNGFKQEGMSEGSFNYYLQRAEKENFQPTKINTVLNTVPKLDTKYTSSEQGMIVPTSNKMDFALNKPDTFFKVQNESGEILLTRDGSFHILDNMVVNSVGDQVLGAGNDPIEAEEGFETLIGIVRTDYTNIDKIGNNNYRIQNKDDVETILDTDEYVLQGSIEKSNVNSVHAMVALIDAHRQFEQSQKAIKSIGEVSKTLVDKLSRM